MAITVADAHAECANAAEEKQDKLDAALKQLLQATEGLACWWGMLLAQDECAESYELTNPRDVVLSFMGCGASTNVTIGELNELLAARKAAWDARLANGSEP